MYYGSDVRISASPWDTSWKLTRGAVLGVISAHKVSQSSQCMISYKSISAIRELTGLRESFTLSSTWKRLRWSQIPGLNQGGPHFDPSNVPFSRDFLKRTRRHTWFELRLSGQPRRWVQHRLAMPYSHWLSVRHFRTVKCLALDKDLRYKWDCQEAILTPRTDTIFSFCSYLSLFSLAHSVRSNYPYTNCRSFNCIRPKLRAWKE